MESESAADTQYPSSGIMLAPPVQLALVGQGVLHMLLVGRKEYWEGGHRRHCLEFSCTHPLLHKLLVMGIVSFETCRRNRAGGAVV